MIARLRRRHLLMWLVLAVALVVAYLAALRARPEEPLMKSLPPVLAPATPAAPNPQSATPAADVGDGGQSIHGESERSGG